MGKKARTKRIAATTEVRTTASTQESEPLAASRWQIVGIVVFLAVAVFCIFFQLRSHQFINFDDPIYVTDNAHVRAGLTAEGLRWALTSLDFNWHPLTWFTHMLDVQLFGVNPGAHLLVNAGLHLANSLLVFAFLLVATGRVWRSGVVAGLFAVHPLHVESVAWIAERKDVLCAFFFLLGILLHCRFVQTRSRLLYAGVIAAFVLGLMAKGMIITLPFVLLVVDYWPLQRWSHRDLGKLKPLAIEKIPLFLLVIPAAIVTLRAQEHVKAVVANIGLMPRLANAAIAYVSYLGKTFWPSGLAVFYPYRIVIAPSLAIMATLFLIGVTVLVLRRAAVRPYLASGWFWYLGILVPVIGIVQIGFQSMADRYTYLSLIGIFAALTWLAADMIHSKMLLGSTAAGVITIMAIVAHHQVGYWQDSLSLFSHAVEVTPTNATAEGNLGEALFRRQDYEGAAQHLRLSLAADPDNALSLNGLGWVLNAFGDSEGAAREWRAAIVADPTRPESYRNLGWYELTAGRKKEAAVLFRKSISLKPDSRTYAELASAEGNLDEAIRRYQQAVAETPDSAELRNDFAATLALAGRDQQALEQYEAALRVSPGYYNAEMNVGAILTRTGRPTEAIDHFRLASKAHPNSFEPHVYLALLLAQTGRNGDAIAEMQKALAMDSGHANAAVQQATGGRFDAKTFIAGMQGQHPPGS